MPTEAVEKPLEETKPEESASSDSDDDDSPPELEEQDAAAMQQQSQVCNSKQKSFERDDVLCSAFSCVTLCN